MTDLRTRDDAALEPASTSAGPRARRGAHRVAPSRVLALLPVALVVVAVALLGGGVWALSTLGDRSVQSASAPAAPPPVEDIPAGGDVEGDVTTSPARPSATPSASSSASSSAPSASSTSAPAVPVDTDVPIVVLNATRTAGLAATTAGTLKDEGWEVSSTGNERAGVVERSEVRFPDADLEATAAAVAQALGVEAKLVLDEDVAEGTVTVVAGADLAD